MILLFRSRIRTDMQKLKSVALVLSYVLEYFVFPFGLVTAAFRSRKYKNSHSHGCGLRVVRHVMSLVLFSVYSIILMLLSLFLWFFFGSLFKLFFILFTFYLFFHIVAHLVYGAYCLPKAPPYKGIVNYNSDKYPT